MYNSWIAFKLVTGSVKLKLIAKMLLVFKTCKVLICGSLQAPKITNNSKEGVPGWNSKALLFSVPLFALWATGPSPQVSSAPWPSHVWGSLQHWPGVDSVDSWLWFLQLSHKQMCGCRIPFQKALGNSHSAERNVVERLWEGVGAGVLQPGFVVRICQ